MTTGIRAPASARAVGRAALCLRPPPGARGSLWVALRIAAPRVPRGPRRGPGEAHESGREGPRDAGRLTLRGSLRTLSLGRAVRAGASLPRRRSDPSDAWLPARAGSRLDRARSQKPGSGGEYQLTHSHAAAAVFWCGLLRAPPSLLVPLSLPSLNSGPPRSVGMPRLLWTSTRARWAT